MCHSRRRRQTLAKDGAGECLQYPLFYAKLFEQGLDNLLDFVGFDTFGTDPDGFGGSSDEGLNAMEVGSELTLGDAGDLPPSAALFLR